MGGGEGKQGKRGRPVRTVWGKCSSRTKWEGAGVGRECLDVHAHLPPVKGRTGEEESPCSTALRKPRPGCHEVLQHKLLVVGTLHGPGMPGTCAPMSLVIGREWLWASVASV